MSQGPNPERLPLGDLSLVLQVHGMPDKNDFVYQLGCGHRCALPLIHHLPSGCEATASSSVVVRTCSTAAKQNVL